MVLSKDRGYNQGRKLMSILWKLWFRNSVKKFTGWDPRKQNRTKEYLILKANKQTSISPKKSMQRINRQSCRHETKSSTATNYNIHRHFNKVILRNCFFFLDTLEQCFEVGVRLISPLKIQVLSDIDSCCEVWEVFPSITRKNLCE